MPVAQSGGSGDYASILIVSAQDHINKNVDVKVDAQTLFVAKAVKFKDKNVGGKSYQIPSGKHKIIVSRNGNILYNKFIFASPKETKIINIP